MATTLQSGAVPTSNPDSAAQLSAILTGAATAPLTNRAFLRITGPDAPRWLNGMVTNDTQSLQPGEGNYNFLLNAQGRILGDCTIYRDPGTSEPVFILQTDKSQIEAIHQHLDKFIIMDDVELASFPDEHLPVSDQNPDRGGLLVAGPNTAAMLQRIGISTRQSSTLTLQSTAWKGNPIDLTRAHGPLVPRFEIWSDLTTILEIQEALIAAGATPVSPEALEHFRILSGTPLYGTDIRNSATAHDLPQETAQTRALHFSKGCYLGQEIVERINSRGNVHRTFTGFSLTGTLPAPGTALSVASDARPVGELTSIAAIPLATGPVQLALGYIRREALDRALPLEYPGGTATPTALPFTIP